MHTNKAEQYMTQIEIIKYQSDQLVKCIESHGADSDYTAVAFYQLQAAKMGKPTTELYKWAEAEFERLKKITLESM